ncbi:MAG TPA: acyl carrier protein [Terriglobales bacterium]|jgi:acyl carrier protein|nr:acyl carrier protein [Terriglobales bacterium]
MDDTRQRLTNCFQVVFPDLPQEALATASTATVAAWDSIAAITLMNVIEEEFGFQMDLDDLADLDSFEKVYSYLQKRLQVA